MELRTRILPKMINSEVEAYLEQNDIIIVPVGTVEMHGGLPLDSETVISEAYALRMAESCDGLVLTGLPYFYAGATASGRGTVQVSVRQGIDYLGAVARSLLRQGFKRQIYISFHGPAHMTCSPMVRDFFDETGVPILYMDLTMQMMHNAKDLFALAYQSGSAGYCFASPKDHMSTTKIPDAAARQALADEGEALIGSLVERMDMPHIAEQMRRLEDYTNAVEAEHPWMPSAWAKRQ